LYKHGEAARNGVWLSLCYATYIIILTPLGGES